MEGDPNKEKTDEKGETDPQQNADAAEENSPEEPPHPLQNPVILARIFGFLNSLDLVQVNRSVCKTWHKASIPQWKILAPVKLVQDPIHGCLDIGTKSVGHFLDELENSRHKEKFIHQTFTLKWWIITDENFDHRQESGFDRLNSLFWTTCGQNMRTLILSRCVIPFSFTLIPLIFWRAIPNLENLSLFKCELEWNIELLPEAERALAEIQNRQQKRKRKPLPQRCALSIPERSTDCSPVELALNAKYFKLTIKSIEQILQQNRQFRIDLEILTRDPCKLKCLQIYNLITDAGFIPIEWQNIMHVFPHLERIYVSEQEVSEYATAAHPVGRRLEELDVMNISPTYDELPSETILRLPTRRLSFDCGYETERGSVCSILEYHASALRMLALSRIPFGEPYFRFPCEVKLPLLVRLYLWGNVSINLNFLNLTPRLKHFSWNTSCYDERTKASRLHTMLGEETFVLSAEDIVTNTITGGLNFNFELRYLRKLDFEGGAMSVDSLRMLGRWLPNVKTFRATVDEDDQLLQIVEQWDDLKRLGLAHGSMVATVTLVYISLTLEAFQSLTSFVWKWCPCQEKILNVPEIFMANFLKRKCGFNVVHPWKNPRREEPPPERPPQQGPPPEWPPQDGLPTKGPPQEGPPSEGPPQELPQPEGPPQEGPPSVGPSQEGPPPEGPPQEEPSQERPPEERSSQPRPPQAGPKNQSPPQEEPLQKAPPQEEPLKKAPPQEEPPQTAPPQEEPPKKEPPKKEPPRKAPPQEGPPKKKPPKKEPPKKEPPKKEPPKKEPPQKAPPQNAPPHKAPPQEEPPKKAPPQEGPPQERPPQEEPPQKAPPQKAPPQEGPPQEGPPQEGPPQKGPPQKGPPKEEPPQEGPPQEGPPQVGPPQEGPPQVGPPPEEPLPEPEEIVCLQALYDLALEDGEEYSYAFLRAYKAHRRRLRRT